jgi:hypothetical protein
LVHRSPAELIDDRRLVPLIAAAIDERGALAHIKASPTTLDPDWVSTSAEFIAIVG